ncbi:MAG: cytochrome c oxidase accessory protein CcoG [Reyranella sp.]|uniref:cytochrome c oxidase accessory protein CcoG n=1 Tax=Reyranella sp. TaxID=1929291 RepID=UPI0027313436|nr:cytochrome c oxidase accessory protein CcoG [Reyranella sp.]MDP1963905.1 cytochrome c oxidase accessory protein CcoG [Reyranella sp.]MDP2374256.1 cytochrome c oxidase accessory protein CcoG [Reyranella sp.]
MDARLHDDDAVSLRTRKAELPLYISRIKVYPRAIKGLWRRVKWTALVLLLGLYYAVPWLRWDRGPDAPDQAILIDLDGRRGWFFDIVIWPQEIYFVTGFLILGAFGLFFATALFGRIWCGYACPQTVWTDLFMLVERLIEGDRNERMRLDRLPMSAGKAARKALKHTVWLAIAAATGGAWVFYYVDAPSTLVKIFRGEASLEVYLFIGLLTATTYTLAGWAREQVCTYMCPWPRFQAAMLDEQSVIVTYQKWRGEPRGKHKAGASWDGRGDCVDCNLCVAVCPTGIDIRDGQQIECIGCGLCIDACNQTMGKVDRPPNLILWDTLANQQAKEKGAGGATWRPLRPRTLLYAALLLVVTAVMLGAFWLRTDTELTVQRDRSPNFVRLSNGDIRNSYAVKILNKSRDERHLRLAVDGLPGATIGVVGTDVQGGAAGTQLIVHPDSVGTFRVFLTVPAGAAPSGSKSIEFTAGDTAGRKSASHDAVFVGPAR